MVAQLDLLKIKPFTNFGNSTHSIENVEFSFIIASDYVLLSPLPNQVYGDMWEVYALNLKKTGFQLE